MLYHPRNHLTPSQLVLNAQHRARLARIAERSAPRPPQEKTLNTPPQAPLSENNRISCDFEYLRAASDLERRIAQLRQNITTGFRELQSLRCEFERLQEVKVPMVRIIAASACDHYGANLTDIVSARKTAGIVLPRQVAMYLARKMTFLSLKSIGNYFGNRDHATVKHAVEKIEALLGSNSDGGKLQDDVDQIRAKVMALNTELSIHGK